MLQYYDISIEDLPADHRITSDLKGEGSRPISDAARGRVNRQPMTYFRKGTAWNASSNPPKNWNS